MGNGMVRRLLERGDDVVVWNRSPVRACNRAFPGLVVSLLRLPTSTKMPRALHSQDDHRPSDEPMNLPPLIHDPPNHPCAWRRRRRQEKCQKLQAEYSPARVTIAASPKEVIEQSSSGYAFSMLSTPAAARAVFEGPQGVLAGITVRTQHRPIASVHTHTYKTHTHPSSGGEGPGRLRHAGGEGHAGV